MPRPKKNPEDRSESMPVDVTQPIPVQVVQPQMENPWAGKYPMEDDPVSKRTYRFTYNQQPGTPLEFTKGRTVLKKGTGRPGTVYEKYCLEDGNEYELPTDVAEHLMSLTYFEQGQARPRCTCVPVAG